jgi:hypothetical protein
MQLIEFIVSQGLLAQKLLKIDVEVTADPPANGGTLEECPYDICVLLFLVYEGCG